MKHLLLLLIASTAYADSWFLAPTTGLVFPSSSHVLYHGYSGSVDYRTGYAQGLQFGRNMGSFKLYIEYQHENYHARSLTLATPYGQASQSDSDNSDSSSILIGATYGKEFYKGYKLLAGAACGETFDNSTSFFFEPRIGVSKKFYGLDLSLMYAYRFAQGQERFGLKSNGTYSIVVDRPDQKMLTLSIGKNF